MELQNKKSTFGIMAVALMICLLAGTCFLTSCGRNEPDAIDMPDAPEGVPVEEDNYAQLELVPQVTIDPMATITPLPMETVAEVDLDGDGVAEAVQVKAMKEGKDGKLYLSNLELPSIQIDMDYFSPEALYNSVNYYDENVDLASYFIFDLDYFLIRHLSNFKQQTFKRRKDFGLSKVIYHIQ